MQRRFSGPGLCAPSALLGRLAACGRVVLLQRREAQSASVRIPQGIKLSVSAFLAEMQGLSLCASEGKEVQSFQGEKRRGTNDLRLFTSHRAVDALPYSGAVSSLLRGKLPANLRQRFGSVRLHPSSLRRPGRLFLRPFHKKFSMQIRLISHAPGMSLALTSHLMTSAFPVFERRSAAQLDSALADPDFDLLHVEVEEDGARRDVGFVARWHLSSVDYIEHLAVDDSMRGRGVGSLALTTLFSQRRAGDKPSCSKSTRG